MSVLYITQQGSYLRKSAGQFIVTRRKEQLAAIPETALSRVVIFGSCQVSSQAIGKMLELGVDLVYFSQHGKFKGILSSGCSKNVFLRMAQYERSLDDQFCLETARAMVYSKLDSSLKTLTRWRRNKWLECKIPSRLQAEGQKEVVSCSSHEELLGTEAGAARTYFALLGHALPPPLEWHGRNRRPPRDPVNALLSLSYMLVLGTIIAECYARGLDPHIGFLHQLDYGRPSLALDILEPLRSLYCDHFAMSCLQAEVLQEKDFTSSKQYGCRLRTEAFQTFIKRFESFRQNGTTRSKPLLHAVRYLVSALTEAVQTNIPPHLDLNTTNRKHAVS